MEICKGSKKYPHDEIVYDEDCPCCVLIEEKTILEDQISKLESEVDKLNSEE